MATSYRRFMDLLDHWANHGVPQMLGTVVSLVAFALGISMFLDPGVFISTPSFHSVFEWASPHAWGTVYIIAAIAVMVTIHTHQQSAQAPVFLLGATFAVQALLQIPQTVNGEVPSGIFMYMGMGWICFITQLVCGARGTNEKTAIYNKP